MENAATQPSGNLIDIAGRGMNGLSAIRPPRPGVALGDRGTTPYTYEETGVGVGPGLMETPANGNGTRPVVIMAPGPFDGIFAFLATPGPMGIPYGGYLAIAAAIGVIVYMNMPASSSKKR